MRIKRSTLDLWKKRLIVLLGVSFVFSLFYIYFVSHFFTITSYELVGVPDVYKETIITRFQSATAQKKYRIFPNNRVISYPRKAMVNALVEVLPNSEKVKIIPVGLHTLRVKVTVYEPFMKIDDTHAITKDGVIYPELKDMSSLTSLSLATTSIQRMTEKDGINSVSVDGINEQKLDNLVILSKKINSVVFDVSRIAIDEYGDVSFHSKMGSSSILFSGSADIDKVWSNIVSAIDTEPLKTKLEKNKDHLEYLDARFGNKVFYKFTNDTKTAIIQSYATTTATTTFSH